MGEWAMESGRGFFISKVRLGLIGSDLVGFSGSRVGFTWIWSDLAGFFPGWVGPNLKARDFRAWQPAAGNFGQAQN